MSVSFDGFIDGSIGHCEPIVPSPPPGLLWDQTGVLCALEQAVVGNCASDDICLPPYSSPPLSNLCIYHPGDVSCPDGPYAHKRLYYDSALDDRACTPCECGVPTGRACSINVKGFESAECAPAVLDVTLKLGEPGPGCIAGPNAKYFKQAPAVISNLGECLARPGRPTGTGTPKGPTTVCCVS